MFYWILIFAGFLSSAITAYLSFKDKKDSASARTSKTFLLIFIVALLGSVVTVSTNINSYIEKLNGSQKADSLNKALAVNNGKLIASQELNTKLLVNQNDSINQILTTQSKLIRSGEKLDSINHVNGLLQKELLENIKGDGNVPYIEIFPGGVGKYSTNVVLIVYNKGKSPLRGLRAEVMDHTARYTTVLDATTKQLVLKANKALDTTNLIQGIWDDYIQVPIGDLAKNSMYRFYNTNLQKVFKHSVLWVTLRWDNGEIFAYITGEYVQGKEFPVFKIQTTHGKDGKPLDSKYITVSKLFDISAYSH